MLENDQPTPRWLAPDGNAVHEEYGAVGWRTVAVAGPTDLSADSLTVGILRIDGGTHDSNSDGDGVAK